MHASVHSWLSSPLHLFFTELPLYLLLGLCCGSVSTALTRSAELSTTLFNRLENRTKLPATCLPVIGGLVVGLLSLSFPEILYWGFQNLNELVAAHPLLPGPEVCSCKQ